MTPFRPGEIVILRGQQYKIAATRYDGKLILHPLLMKETAMDMMVRLQSTTGEPTKVRVELKESAQPDPQPRPE